MSSTKILSPVVAATALLLLTARAEMRTETYKTVGDVKLNLTIEPPEGWKANDQRPAIVFCFGGGWTSGTPKQFENH